MQLLLVKISGLFLSFYFENRIIFAAGRNVFLIKFAFRADLSGIILTILQKYYKL
jgi:hypothetical protein